ncbi:TRAP-type C4-dicarboxylate transport system permease small subunit [Oceanisphaera litoralis]|uniref:TRAP transporter small permease subunit n=1 Tax=Oceanisphaera litoralis TaxID=225144 RepID=UPI00195EB85A|nr:TRAP transporter small permease subunit [Oceanisphaera litoralis]MBM7456625.1 TRAP-type C4-dicarboxylate transport system permease small subunit [Oceanisphaera litoralis]
MAVLTRIADFIALLMYRLAGVLIIFMMLVVVADVAARALFAVTAGGLDLTFVGGIELVKFSLLFSMLFAFPHAVDKGQIVVDLFTQQMDETRLRFFTGGYTICFGFLGGALCWRFFEAAHSATQTGELTQDLLLPLSNIYYVAALALAMLAARGLLAGQATLFQQPQPGSHQDDIVKEAHS